MTDGHSKMQESLGNMLQLGVRAFGAPELLGPRESATPQKMFVDLMAREPVRDLGDGYYSLLKMEDILFLTRHKDVEQGAKYLGSDRPAIPLGLDGPEHTKYRKLLDPVFTAKRVAPLAENVRKEANALIDRFIDDGRADAYFAWCEPLPSTIFLSIMGLPMEDLDDFLHFKNLTLGTDSAEELGAGAERLSEEARMAGRGEAVVWLQSYFDRDLDRREKEAQPRDDMIGWLLTSEVDGHRLSRQELLDIIGLLMIAGLDTVTASLACFLSYFARHPEDRKRILDEPTLLPSAIEELMRFESPVSDGFRLVCKDVTLPSGPMLPAGSAVHVSWAAANLDPDAFDDPLTVDLERNPNRHIGFASGFHRCLGSHLARMEMQVAMAVWHVRIPDYRIEEGAELVYRLNPRAPHRLPLVWA